MTSKVVAITGGTRGIGRDLVSVFRDRGYQVGVCSRSVRDASLPDYVFHVQADVRRRPAVIEFISSVQRKFGRVDALVNNAGVSKWSALENIDEVFAAELIETNVLGTLWGCAAAAEVLSPEGCIINISSLAGKRGSARNSVYCAAKFAVNGITQALAKELGPRGIRVNAVCPVYVTTDTILDALKSAESPTGGASVQGYLEEFSRTQTALGRLPTGREVAEAVFFLCSPAASAITGQCINVDCGTLPQ